MSGKPAMNSKEQESPPLSQGEQECRQELRALEERIDPRTAQRLAQARRNALAAPASRWRFSGPRWLAPATGMAFACVLSLWALIPHGLLSGYGPGVQPRSGDSRPQMTSEELYEHLDFYAWLASNPAEIERLP